jgi:hypothetical protein
VQANSPVSSNESSEGQIRKSLIYAWRDN